MGSEGEFHMCLLYFMSAENFEALPLVTLRLCIDKFFSK